MEESPQRETPTARDPLRIRRAARATLPFVALAAVIAAMWFPADHLAARALAAGSALAAGLFAWTALGDRLWSARLRATLGCLGLLAAAAAALGALPALPRSGVMPWVAAIADLLAGTLCVVVATAPSGSARS